MLKNFEKYISTKRLADKQDKILLAVSGGVDSMVMYELFYKLGYNIAIAHCNFSLRGEEADGESEMVRHISQERGTPFHFVKFDTIEAMRINGKSMQETARELRYNWFDTIAKEHEYTKIAIAHNLNDSVETFFINSVRGCGIRGLSGITITRNSIIRPISYLSRADIEAYAAKENIEYRNDSSNNSIKYLRNKIRHIIVPKMEEIAPNYLSVMSENMERVSQAASFIDSMIKSISKIVVSEKNGVTIISLDKIEKANIYFIAFELLKRYGFNSSTVEDIVRCYLNGSTARWFNNNRSYLQGGDLLIETNNKRRTILSVERLNRGDVETLKTDSDTALLDFDKITFPVNIRTWRDGDNFIPFGMQGSKKVGDYMSDTKKSIFEREHQRVAEAVVNGETEIIWLVGERISELVKIDNKTKTILKISIV